MSLFESISSAIRSVYGHKMRSVLTMLGIIIGISSVIIITSLGAGVKDTIFSQLDSINKTMIQVYAWNISSMDDLIDTDDMEAIKKIDNVDNVAAMIEYGGQILQLRNPSDTKEGVIVGVDENYRLVEDVNLTHGRFISKNDVENHSLVAVISEETAMDVFGQINCVGQKMEVESYNGKNSITVIGVFHAESFAMGMGSTPLTRSLMAMPFTAFGEMVYQTDYVDFLAVIVKDGSKSADTAKRITDTLNIRNNLTDGYYASSMASELDMADNILNIITGFVAFVAAISLFVGGVGVMNIMMVTVTERTREIGIRKSLGATNGNIKFQFVMEAMILTGFGGIIGIAFGFLGAKGIGLIITSLMGAVLGGDFIPVTDISTVLIAFGVSGLVGIIFGVYPAGKAAKLDPIEALRYE